MSTTLILSGAALLFGVICFGAADEHVVPKRAEKTNAPPAAKASTKAIKSTDAKLTEKSGAKPSTKPIENIPAGPGLDFRR